MRKARVISLAFVVMLFFSLTAFTAPFKPAKNTGILSARYPVHQEVECQHNYIVLSYGDWTLISSEWIHGNPFMTANTYERTVYEKCTYCGKTRTRTETKKTTSFFFGLIEG